MAISIENKLFGKLGLARMLHKESESCVVPFEKKNFKHFHYHRYKRVYLPLHKVAIHPFLPKGMKKLDIVI